MRTHVLSLLLCAASSIAFGQYGEQLYASIDHASNHIGCTAYVAVNATAENSRKSTASYNSTSAASHLRLINQSFTVQALVNSSAGIESADYRILRTVDPSLGWEFVAEVDDVYSDGPIAINDENPLPGRVLYKLESRKAEKDWETLDIRVIDRPLGVHIDDIDFLTASFGALTLPQTMLPDSEYTVEIFDLQGGQIQSSHVRFGHKLKVHTAHLPFGVYEVVVTGERKRVAKYFLATGNH
jgi:hypothetical protein